MWILTTKWFKMKVMYRKSIIRAAIAACSLCGLTLSVASCSYDELTPKTDDRSEYYQIPKGEIPSAEEQAEVKAIRDEYNAAIS